MPMSNNQIVLGITTDDDPVTYLPTSDGHLLVAGSAGTGKTEVLKNILSTALAHGIHAYVFEILRGGAELGLPPSPAIRLAAKLDAAADLMTALQLEIRNRRELCAAHGVGSIQELPEEIRPPHLLAVLDETSYLLGAGVLHGDEKIMHDHILEVLSSLLLDAQPARVTVVASAQSVGGLRNGHSLLPSFTTRLLLGRTSREDRAVVLGSPHAPRVDGGPGYGLYRRGSAGDISSVTCQMASRDHLAA